MPFSCVVEWFSFSLFLLCFYLFSFLPSSVFISIYLYLSLFISIYLYLSLFISIYLYLFLSLFFFTLSLDVRKEKLIHAHTHTQTQTQINIIHKHKGFFIIFDTELALMVSFSFFISSSAKSSFFLRPETRPRSSFSCCRELFSRIRILWYSSWKGIRTVFAKNSHKLKHDLFEQMKHLNKIMLWEDPVLN